MRLGQLSRKVSVRTNEIVAFLATKGITVEDSSNARIDETHSQLVIAHFAPALLATESTQNADEPENPRTGEDATAVAEPAATLVESPATIEAPSAPADKSEPSGADVDLIHEVDGLIKAPRVELQGLKVLGKIDLPGPRKKDADANAEAGPSVAPPDLNGPARKAGDRQKPERRHQKARTGKNPIALERERRVREQEEQRLRQAELDKQRKTQHYQKRVKPKGPTKAVRIHNEEATPVIDTPDAPKSLWGRFIKWLTSY